MRLPGLLCLALLLAPAGALRATAAVPLEAFAAAPQTTNVAISPNGALLAWCVTKGNDAHIVVFDVSTRKYIQTLPIEKDRSVLGLGWVDDATLLFSVRYPGLYGPLQEKVRRYFGRTFAVDVTTGKRQNLLMDASTRRNELDVAVVAWRTKKPGAVVMALYQTPAMSSSEEGMHPASVGWSSRILEVDTHTGKSSNLEGASYETDEWLFDDQGTPIARREWNRGRYRILAKKDSQGWREIFREAIADPQERPTFAGVTRDGSAIVVEATKGLERRILEAIPFDGSAASSFFADAESDVAYADRDRVSGALTAVWLGGLEEAVHFIDPETEQRQRKVVAAFPGKRVRIRDRSADSQRLIAEVFGPAAPSAYYLVDLGTGKADLVGEEYPALSRVELSAVRMIHYTARDGAKVPAYFTLPPGSAGKKLPLVVLPHDGPESRDHATFHWLAQFIASPGYAVLQPQFRGSEGFGTAWRKAGRQQWGGLMQQDLLDGIDSLAKEGVVDATRVCIVGVGYGGYAALTAATFTPKQFRCAVSVNGISNVPGWFGSAEVQWSERYWRDNIGSPFDQRVKDRSPLNAVPSADTPILLMHATDDIRVPIEQSSQMAYALSQYDKEVQFVKLENDGHDLERTGTRIGMLGVLEKFLAEHLR